MGTDGSAQHPGWPRAAAPGWKHTEKGFVKLLLTFIILQLPQQQIKLQQLHQSCELCMEKLTPADAGPEQAEEPRAGSTAAMIQRTWVHTGQKDLDTSNSKNCQGYTRDCFKEGT